MTRKRKAAQSKMSRLPKGMRVDADTLAIFADLEPSQADRFRNDRGRGFMPEGFWTGAAVSWNQSGGPTTIWETEQRKLREAWQDGFPLSKAVDLISDAAKLSEIGQWLQQATEQGGMLTSEYGVPLEPPKSDSYPYQHVIMMLAIQPWRAQICAICGHHFVKEVQRDRYCSSACSKEATRRRRNQWWKENRAKV